MPFAAGDQGRITHYYTFFSSSPAPFVSSSTFHISLESCHFHPFPQNVSSFFLLYSYFFWWGKWDLYAISLFFCINLSFCLFFCASHPFSPCLCPTWKALLPPSLCLTGSRHGGTARLIFLWSKALPLMSLWALYPQSPLQRETKQD